ncbi:unnamed protein product [Bursaphelenchus okinawaensis]|uniref:Uncharacterized protein n=1 Tax=Bursaphelenchus okinawaensis TaxID=465554 RepID=A0A811K4L7_9BILA|nr:unnamed protein product [Bursaphelenchus okinawaensis]CAG9092354.1 unnamed protein product [Bursaphelenchus okinawaensis]
MLSFAGLDEFGRDVLDFERNREMKQMGYTFDPRDWNRGIENVNVKDTKAFHTQPNQKKQKSSHLLVHDIVDIPTKTQSVERKKKPHPKRKHRKKDRNRTRPISMPLDDDLFIEPAGDYDVVYGDYNNT